MLTELFALILVIGVVIGVFFLVKKMFMLAINSVIGFFALFAVKLLLPSLEINFWSVVITAIGGIFGLLVVVLLHAFGIAF